MKCPGSRRIIGPIAAGSHVRCLWCGQDVKRIAPAPGERETMPEHKPPEPSGEESEEARAQALYEAHANAVHRHYGGDDIDVDRARLPWENIGNHRFWHFMARVAKLREPGLGLAELLNSVPPGYELHCRRLDGEQSATWWKDGRQVASGDGPDRAAAIRAACVGLATQETLALAELAVQAPDRELSSRKARKP